MKRAKIETIHLRQLIYAQVRRFGYDGRVSRLVQAQVWSHLRSVEDQIRILINEAAFMRLT